MFVSVARVLELRAPLEMLEDQCYGLLAPFKQKGNAPQALKQFLLNRIMDKVAGEKYNLRFGLRPIFREESGEGSSVETVSRRPTAV